MNVLPILRTRLLLVNLGLGVALTVLNIIRRIFKFRYYREKGFIGRTESFFKHPEFRKLILELVVNFMMPYRPFESMILLITKHRIQDDLPKLRV